MAGSSLKDWWFCLGRRGVPMGLGQEADAAGLGTSHGILQPCLATPHLPDRAEGALDAPRRVTGRSPWRY